MLSIVVLLAVAPAETTSYPSLLTVVPMEGQHRFGIHRC
jgi:hypothetical protein